MKHKHYDMIVAKAANMDLVIFRKDYQNTPWRRLVGSELPTYESKEYFLCLPQHKDACLHWLNGGEVEFFGQFTDDWTEYDPIKSWGIGSVFMQSDYEFRIKPHKEKRWIAVNTKNIEHLGGLRKVNICSHAFLDKSQAEEYLNLEDSQLIEIEVDV